MCKNMQNRKGRGGFSNRLLKKKPRPGCFQSRGEKKRHHCNVGGNGAPKLGDLTRLQKRKPYLLTSKRLPENISRRPESGGEARKKGGE